MNAAASGIRFAPSPTGRFHVGNLRTAWVSRLWSRTLGEPWVVRFEDIDLPRVVPGARETQLADLAALGLVPDRVYSQVSRRDRHYALLERAVGERAVYPCTCSRKDVQDALAGLASAPHGAFPIYTGHCRDAANRGGVGAAGVAWRFRGADASGVQDFIVARTATPIPDRVSFVPAYHWACAIDDFDGNYRLLVRAWDLAPSTPIQRGIQDWIARSEKTGRGYPAVFHASLVVRNDGHRLEKRTTGVTLGELLAGGWTVERIRERFEASIRIDPALLAPGGVFGETDREKSLADLGF